MESKKITITLRPDGTASVEASGFSGDTCSTDVDAFVRALDAEVIQTVPKSEDARTQEANQIKGGTR